MRAQVTERAGGERRPGRRRRRPGAGSRGCAPSRRAGPRRRDRPRCETDGGGFSTMARWQRSTHPPQMWTPGPATRRSTSASERPQNEQCRVVSSAAACVRFYLTEPLVSSATRPVLVAEAALVELAVLVPRQVVDQVDGSGALEPGQTLPAEGEQLLGEARSVDLRLRLDDREDTLAPLVVGDPDGAGISHRGVLEQHGVDLGGVDVHAAGDDEVGRTIGEEEEAVLVDPADVAEGEVVAAIGGSGLLLVAEVLEPRLAGRLDPDEPFLVGAQPLTLGVAHVEVDRVGTPDGARLGEPGRAVDPGAIALGGRVVLVDDRAEPLDDPLLHRHGTRRGSVDDGPQRRDVVAIAHRRSEREQPVEHRRHEVHVRHAMLLDEGKGLLGVPALHHHHRHAAAERRHERDGERGGVVQRAGAQVHVAVAVLVHRHARDQAVGIRRLGDALRVAGGARRVEHGGAQRGVVDVGAALRREHVVPRLEPGHARRPPRCAAPRARPAARPRHAWRRR